MYPATNILMKEVLHSLNVEFSMVWFHILVEHLHRCLIGLMSGALICVRATMHSPIFSFWRRGGLGSNIVGLTDILDHPENLQTH